MNNMIEIIFIIFAIIIFLLHTILIIEIIMEDIGFINKNKRKRKISYNRYQRGRR